MDNSVDLITFTSEPIDEGRLSKLSEVCNKIKVVHYHEFDPKSIRSLTGYFSKTPRFLIDTFNKEFVEATQEFCNKYRYDCVIVSQIDMTPYLKFVKEASIIFDELELAVLQEASKNQKNNLAKMHSAITWSKHKQYVKRVLQNVDGCTVTSRNEKLLLQDIWRSCKVEIIPNGVDISSCPNEWDCVEPDSLVYAGAITYYANLDAVRYFIQDMLPEIQKHRPGVKLYVTGKYNEKLKNQLPQNESVIFTGYLDDVRPRIAQSWISIVPLRIGGGTRLKILESMALGTPVVSTSKGAEGLNLVDGKEIIIRDEPVRFSEAIVDLLGNETLRKNLAVQGRKAVEKYDWDDIGKTFKKFIQAVILEKKHQ